MTDLKGKTLFITGASRGIGKAIALRAAKDGASIAIAAKTTEPHPKLPGTIYTAAEEIERAGGNALPCIVDIRFEDQVEAAVEKTIARFGRIDSPALAGAARRDRPRTLKTQERPRTEKGVQTQISQAK